jgi:hypothetical protein
MSSRAAAFGLLAVFFAFPVEDMAISPDKIYAFSGIA